MASNVSKTGMPMLSVKLFSVPLGKPENRLLILCPLRPLRPPLFLHL